MQKACGQSFAYAIQNIDYINDEYRELLEEDGWETLELTEGWWIHRKAYEGKHPALFTDYSVQIDALTKQFQMLSTVFGFIILMAFFILLWQTVQHGYHTTVIYIILFTLLGSVSLFYIFLLAKLKKAINTLTARNSIQAK